MTFNTENGVAAQRPKNPAGDGYVVACGFGGMGESPRAFGRNGGVIPQRDGNPRKAPAPWPSLP
jgi:hypothetical protein